MIDYDELYNEVKNNQCEYRFKHTEAVIKRALEYAEIYNVNKEIVKIVALAHDIAKEFSEKEIEKYLNEYNIQLDETEKINNSLIHAKIGAYICKNKYNFTEDMVNAVKYHTTGREKMSILEKIIYLADATEETREFTASYESIVKKDIDKGMVEISRWVINKLLANSKIIHLDSIKCYNYYNKKLLLR